MVSDYRLLSKSFQPVLEAAYNCFLIELMELYVFEYDTGNQSLKIGLVDKLYLIRVLLLSGVDGLLGTVFVVVATSRPVQVYLVQNNSRIYYDLN